MRILVTGGRDYDDQITVGRALQAACLDLIDHLPPWDDGSRPPTVVHGGARGLDTTAATLAAEAGWNVEAHPADWDAHGRAAGPIRNQKMADLGADLCIAFPGGRGTADMVRRAEKAGIPVRHITNQKEA